MSARLLKLSAATSALALGMSLGMSLGLSQAWAQSPLPRANAPAGAIVAAKGGEEMRFVREDLWRAALVQQQIVTGDVLRTNAIGNLAILFADQTQIRVGRNSTLTVADVARSGDANTQLQLDSGNIWARASRGGSGVDVKTPAAVAAIRGTDWSLSVQGGRTSLVVLEGVVELRNPQGSVTVRQGEGAVASIGQAPTKFVLTNSNDREQMLFYLSLRDTFSSLSITPLEGPVVRGERARIMALPPERRRAEDWLTLAEIGFSYDGRPAAAAALAQARSLGLSAAQRTRADLVEASLLGSQHRWAEAAALFARAEKSADPKRRALAAYGRYITQSLADPRKVYAEPTLSQNDPVAALAHAYIVAFKQDLNAAAEVLRAAEKRFPKDTRIAVTAAQVAFALNRREEMRASIARAKAIDPDDPEVIAADSNIRGDIDGEVNAAVEALRRAAGIAPGNSNVWNALGLFEFDRDRPLAAEEALRRAIAEDPQSPVGYANLAIVLLDQSRVDEAGALIDKALELDPAFSVGYIARGRYLLQKGDTAAGIEAILAGSAANPALSQGLLLSAIAHYQNGDEELADQALENADRLDPNDPVISVVRTAISIDQYRADQAVLNAREAVRRYRQRGGDFAGIAVNKEAGSYPAQAYRFLNLNEWGRFYGDRTFDPFNASSYFDQAAAQDPNLLIKRPTISSVEDGDVNLKSFTLTVQGLFFDPLAVAGRIGRIDLVRRPFVDTEIGGSLVSRGGKIGWEADATVQGFTNQPSPTSFSLTASRSVLDGRNQVERENATNAAFFIGSAPTAADRFLVFGAAGNGEPGVARVSNRLRFFSGQQETTSLAIGGGWSHSFSDRNVLTGAAFFNRGFDRRLQEAASLDLLPFLVQGQQSERIRTEGGVAALNHTIGLGEHWGIGDLTLRYGIEGQSGRTLNRTLGNGFVTNFLTGQIVPTSINESTDVSFQAHRLYADLFWRPSDRFEAEAGVERTGVEIDSARTETSTSPRLGVAVSPFEGQWLRAAWRRDGLTPLSFTLAPVTTVGLVPNVLPVSIGGHTDTLALRWDAEWTPHFFTSLDYQRQSVEGLSLPLTDTFDSVSVGKARVERLAATANLWLGYGIGVFATVGTTNTEIRSAEAPGADVPFIAGKFARAGVTFVHPSRLKFTFAGTYVGDITGNLQGQALDDYWTADTSITWETPDRRLLVGLSVLNLFDRTYELAPDIPGPGRTVAASLKARF